MISCCNPRSNLGVILALFVCSFIVAPHRPALVDALIQKTTTPALLDVPTYSLATLNEDGSTNMNILTYATPVSIAPTRVWTMGLYKDTLSDENLRRTGVCVLQLLTDQHADAVPLLGGTSGRDVDKRLGCAKLGMEWEDLNDKHGFQVLPGCASYIKLTVEGGVVDAGSHFIVPFCEVSDMYSSQVNGDGEQTASHLSTGKLREWGVITEKGRVADNKQLIQSS
mmetsp:Transcript_9188/g.14701  ORF Transcript_9188/g.14701 Transcript_9188/m.14701 type:complete len:225 (+) Transcript_9188:179-853(+)